MTNQEINAFAERVNANRLELAAKFVYLDMCTEAYREQEKQLDATYEQVLQAGDFRVKTEGYQPRSPEDPKPGDRITTKFWTFLLSEEDFQRMLDLAHPIQVAGGLVDEQGHYIENWMMRMIAEEIGASVYVNNSWDCVEVELV